MSIIAGCSFVDWLASEESEDSDIDPAIRTAASLITKIAEGPKIIEDIPLELILPKYDRIEGLILKNGQELTSNAKGCSYLYEHKRISGKTNFHNQYFSHELKEIDSIIIIINNEDYELILVSPSDF
jgi:hypothetical protein